MKFTISLGLFLGGFTSTRLIVMHMCRMQPTLSGTDAKALVVGSSSAALALVLRFEVFLSIRQTLVLHSLLIVVTRLNLIIVGRLFTYSTKICSL